MLEFKEVSFAYKNSSEKVLQTVNFSIDKGECVLIAGASGNGKSTLVHLMNGLIPTLFEGEIEGTILFDEKPTTVNNPTDIAKDIGYISQDPRGQFFTTNTTSELVFAMENFGFSIEMMEKNLQEIIDLLKISDLVDKDIFTISSGERQKISIGCSLCLKPKILILDEPSSNLDYGSTIRLGQLLAKLKKAGYTIIIAEHRLHYLQEIIDKVLLVQNQHVTVCQMENLFSLSQAHLRSFSIFDEPLQAKLLQESSEKLLELSNISYQDILKKIHLEIHAGDVIGLIGKNGAGKTTLLRLLTTIIHPTSGQLTNLKKQHPFLVMQDMDYQFFTESVVSELALGNEHTTLEQRQHLLEDLGLDHLEKQLPFQLSGGQKQRLLIGIASLAKSRVLLFDEPTSGLDYLSMQQVNQVLQMISEKSGLMIATHDIEFLYQMCNRIIYLNEGTIQEDFPLTEKTKQRVEELFFTMIDEQQKEGKI